MNEEPERQHGDNDPPRPSVDFGWNIFGNEFDPEHPEEVVDRIQA
eukprot:CAMPEP_0114361098 /NCGR_PEP_ID=MMETSP0101-20121206/24414_1 /TAXON_ID=38822 ORGANISM="Pteridomonas danica, Strain PT" /NCGR_SAMPLE_ID=MMETSP0101 /ASSEMBLY_ACC=CAM_ASM_000211 /LENGTH=44 /DNA_ID= /DNA_START= /DNA_END= /DNA_ORIENTATION=